MHIFEVCLPVTSTSRFRGFFLQFVTAITGENLVVCNKPTTGLVGAKVSSLHPTRILLVDDFARWRREIRLLLKSRPEWNVIGEATDGREAIEKAVELCPDIVLLDIGMPLMNGIEAAKVISQRCPKTKILFVTQDGDRELRNAAMRVGAAGYILKTNAGKELFNAITTALYCYSTESVKQVR